MKRWKGNMRRGIQTWQRMQEERMDSIWTKTVEMQEFPQLEKDIRTKVLIIGGGMTGLLCAYFLQQAGVDYCLVEKDRICSGITHHTTAKITSQHGLIYDRLIRKEGVNTAGLYRKANELALKRYKDIGWFVDCDMEEADAFVYALHDTEKLEKEIQAASRLGYTADFCEHPNLPFETAGAVRFPNQIQFHPLKFASAIAKNLTIYEHTEVREMTEYFALTANGSIAAEKVIVATHFPFINTRGSYYLKLYQERSYVLALENAPKVDGMYIDGEKNGLSFRNYKNFLLLGGGGHRTGKPHRKKGDPECGMETLEQFAKEHFKDAKIAAKWATQDCMSLDGMPYIGNYSRSTPDLFVAAGYNKWGMTGSMLAAMMLSDLVQEIENEFVETFSPGRNILKPQLAINTWEAFKGILRPTLQNRCSHMGCVLQWNYAEKTWDCPCHGSRFDEDGELLENPAVNGLKKKQ